jgi:hypothetical protein
VILWKKGIRVSPYLNFKACFLTTKPVTAIWDLKWKDGYVCKKCGKAQYCKGINEFDRQCTKCGRLDSPTAGMLFHNCKFSLLKAFYIVYQQERNQQLPNEP